MCCSGVLFNLRGDGCLVIDFISTNERMVVHGASPDMLRLVNAMCLAIRDAILEHARANGDEVIIPDA